MKKGIILYVAEGREELDEWMDLSAEKKRLEADDVCLATSESELAYGWWYMLTRGMQQISCLRASYDLVASSIRAEGRPFRLCG
ncbi:hypothetical protein [Desulfoferrobacter suflitae]|uniref:hypothetical protein n=1 Tax=Desulfoferrobacter suflitae TaxID=2865782 RepID=UPI0021643F32|nr:hypothetical protein [Desulfoferrobacter suflitae]MCK8600464.1 hypothetical protein [Desulfoferrobacter suflitae]